MFYPSLQEQMEKSKKLKDIWIGYIESLRKLKQNDIRYALYANKLQECWEIRKNNLRKVKKEARSIQKFLKKWAKANKVEIVFLKRIKDFIGLNEKIRLYFKEKRTLDQIMDFVGFRIIIKTNLPEEENIDLCYKLMNDLIAFFILDKKYSPMQSEPLVDLGPHPKEIIVPEQPRLQKGFEQYVKDYVKFPKKNGYQSLHVVVRNPFSKHLFELQIRTEMMDLRAESGPAKHKSYKDMRYGEGRIDWDPYKLHIKGFKVINVIEGKFEDNIGLSCSQKF